jgi:hypothetical protein
LCDGRPRETDERARSERDDGESRWCC